MERWPGRGDAPAVQRVHLDDDTLCASAETGAHRALARDFSCTGERERHVYSGHVA